jgi:hypothetical protein
VIPADHWRIAQASVARTLVEAPRSLDLRWPKFSSGQYAANLEARSVLEAEPGDS